MKGSGDRGKPLDDLLELYKEKSPEASKKGRSFGAVWEEVQLRIEEMRHDLTTQLQILSSEIARRMQGVQEGEVSRLFAEAKKLEGQQLQKILLLAMERLGDLQSKEIKKNKHVLKREAGVVDLYTYFDSALYPSEYAKDIDEHQSASTNLRAAKNSSETVRAQITAKQRSARERLQEYVHSVLGDPSIPLNKKYSVDDIDRLIRERQHKAAKQYAKGGEFSLGFTPEQQKKLLKGLYYALSQRQIEVYRLQIREIQGQILSRMVQSKQGDVVIENLKEAQKEFQRLCREEGIQDSIISKDFPPDSVPFETSFYPVDPEERLKKFLYPHIVKQYMKKAGKEYEG